MLWVVPKLWKKLFLLFTFAGEKAAGSTDDICEEREEASGRHWARSWGMWSIHGNGLLSQQVLTLNMCLNSPPKSQGFHTCLVGCSLPASLGFALSSCRWCLRNSPSKYTVWKPLNVDDVFYKISWQCFEEQKVTQAFCDGNRTSISAAKGVIYHLFWQVELYIWMCKEK